MGLKSIGFLAAASMAMALGGAAMLQPAQSGGGLVITEPTNNQAPQQKANAAVALSAREEEIAARQQRRLWATYRYRKNGKHRAAGDRAHKRMKSARRSGR